MEPAKKVPRVLLTTEPARIDETVLSAEATNLVRDLVNIPAGALGPAELQKAAEEVAAECGASVIITSGTDLVSGYPMIHAVGMAATADRAPRLIEMRSEEHTSELQSPIRNSYAVFCLKQTRNIS